jgi:S1-C subfamily serine protease
LAATVSAGDSGAPVLNRDGALVGIVYARSTRRDGTAYAVRAGELSGLAR